MKKFILLTFILATLALFSTTALAAVEKPISFFQDDSKWGSESYSITGSQSQTIANSGCGPTAMAMVLHYYGEEDITPVETAEFAVENYHRTRSNGTSWAFFEDVANEYDLDFKQTASSVEALEWMNTKEDPLIICSMGPGLWTRQGHFIVLWDVEDGVAHINDPASTKPERETNSFKKVASQCKQYFCFEQKLPKINEQELLSQLTNRSIYAIFEKQDKNSVPYIKQPVHFWIIHKNIFGNNIIT